MIKHFRLFKLMPTVAVQLLVFVVCLTTAAPDRRAVTAFLENFQPAYDELVSNPLLESKFGSMYVAVSHPLIGDHYFIGRDDSDQQLQDHWGIGSLSKTFMATLIIKFVEEGLLTYEQTVPELLPELDTSQAYGEVTVRQLLTMTSGVPDFFNDPQGLLAQDFNDPNRDFTVQDVVDGAVAAGDVDEPGTPGYSSTNYVVLQAIAEKIGGGKTAQELYEEYIYTPLGITSDNTVLPPRNGNTPIPLPRSEAILTQTCANEFEQSGWKYTEQGAEIGDEITDTLVPLIDLAGASGSMWSTLEDMLLWTKSGTGNSLLTKESQTTRLTETNLVDLQQYGMGIHNCYGNIGDGITGYWGHAGEAFGYETLSCHHPEDDGSFFVSTTSCGIEFTVNTGIFTSYLTALEKAKEAVLIPDPLATEVFLANFKPEFDEIISSPSSDNLFGSMYVALSHPLIGDHYFFGKDATSAEEHWGIGSLSKTFVATLIILFVEQGLISMDQTVPELLPDLDTSEAYGEVTLYQLLSMTSGVPDFLNDPDGLLGTTFENPDQQFATQDIVDGAVASAPVEPPGTAGYSSTNYVILQDIAERVGGKAANELYIEHLYRPLGMSLNATVLPPRNSNAPVPKPRSVAINTAQCDAEFNYFGYNTTENGVAIGDDITDTLSPLVDLAGGAGSMWSNLNDMLQWAKAGTGNSLLTPASVDQRLDWRYVSQRQYGLGIHACWAYDDEGYLGPTGYWGHAGEAFGYESLSCNNPENRGSFFVATTSCGMEQAINMKVFTSYVNALDVAVETTQITTAPSDPAGDSPSPISPAPAGDTPSQPTPAPANGATQAPSQGGTKESSAFSKFSGHGALVSFCVTLTLF